MCINFMLHSHKGEEFPLHITLVYICMYPHSFVRMYVYFYKKLRNRELKMSRRSVAQRMAPRRPPFWETATRNVGLIESLYIHTYVHLYDHLGFHLFSCLFGLSSFSFGILVRYIWPGCRKTYIHTFMYDV